MRQESRGRSLKNTNYRLTLVHLYPKEMNIYGDTGNRLVLQRRAEWRGVEIETKLIGVGDTLPADTDIILGGGGQDAGQDDVQKDLAVKAQQLRSLADNGVVMLMICGMYQLFGHSFVTNDGTHIAGIGVLPLKTVGGDTRMIGNTVYESPWGELVGYENHSGVTTLDDPQTALCKIVKGDGNNGQDGTEGCRVHNVFGTYSHGPLLPKNPVLADELLRLALLRKYGSEIAKLTRLNDDEELAAHRTAKTRPR